jgi:hypothetical protein
MKLLTEEIAQTIPKLYEQEHKGPDAIVWCKFFDPCSCWSWYVLEFDGVDTFFGLVRGLETEFGYFSLKELQEYKGPLGIGIERDIWFNPCSLEDVKQRLE